jgi:CDP-paratose 2-epimerase
VRAYRGLLDRIDGLRGRAFNLGGGPANSVSLLDLLAEIEAVLGRPVPRTHAETRVGDQPWFVSDTGGLGRAIGWQARIGWREGLRDLARWLDEAQVGSRERAVA